MGLRARCPSQTTTGRSCRRDEHRIPQFNDGSSQCSQHRLRGCKKERPGDRLGVVD